MELRNYVTLKQGGQVKLVRKEAYTYEMTAKRYSPDTGEALEAEIIPVDAKGINAAIGQIEREIAERQAHVAALRAIAADISAAEIAAAGAVASTPT